jgi:hypothetical protein
MDIFQKLRDAEYALKDHIESVLQEKIGHDWMSHCSVQDDRRETWRKRRDAVDPGDESAAERLIACSDLSDLATILREQWDIPFSEVFGDLATMEVYLRILERYQDSGRRELWMYEKYLIYGILGEILARIARYCNRKRLRRTTSSGSSRSWTIWGITGSQVLEKWSSPGPCSSRATIWSWL